LNKIYDLSYNNLNLLRGLAAYGVATCHYFYYINGIDFFQTISSLFVEFFFVLSGFVLTPQLIKVHKNNKLLFNFYLRRWMRTIPAYLIALISFSILFNKFDLDFLKYIFLIQNFVENFLTSDYFFIAWSLSIEEYFYLAFPITLIIFNKQSIQKICIIFIMFFLLAKILTINLTEINHESFRINTFLRLDSIVLGVLVRIYLDKIKKIILFFIPLTLYLLFSFILDIKNLEKLEMVYLIYIYQLCSATILIVFISFEKFTTNINVQKIFRILANQAYSVYLFHMLIVYSMKSLNFGVLNNFYFYFIMLFVFTIFFYKYIEKPINLLRPKV